MFGSGSIPEFESIIGQQRPKQILDTFLRKETIPHALLFTGIDGIGKRSIAMLFAMACNCLNAPYHNKTSGPNPPHDHSEEYRLSFIESPDQSSCTVPCGTCRSCKKIRSGNHPDIIHVEPDGSIIKIGQIRSLCRTIGMRPYEARQRVAIISHAETMNPEAGNALLKVLEEPPDQTMLILIAAQTSDLLPTIVSRCQHIRFSPISRHQLKTFLMDKHDLSQEQASVLSDMAGGSVSRALDMEKTHWMDRRKNLITLFDFSHAGCLSSKPVDFLLALADRLSKNKEELSTYLYMLKIWIRDLVVAKCNTQKIMNADMCDEIENSSAQIEIRGLLSQFSAIQTAEREIQTNLNIRLITETLILQLSGHLPGEGKC